MTETLLTIGALVLGWLLGWYPNRQRNDHYQDMRDLTNQFANLSAQLINQVSSNTQQPTYFPTPAQPVDGELQQEVEESFFSDMQGGAP